MLFLDAQQHQTELIETALQWQKSTTAEYHCVEVILKAAV